jgi:hypothetical protein
MELIAAHAGHRYWWGALERPDAFRPPTPGMPFTCLLWDACGTWPAADRSALVRAVLDAGCRYAVCAGRTCERWHDDFDEVIAWRAAARERAPPGVVTTWHAGEPVEDVAEFFVLHARAPEEPVTEHLVVQVGPEWDLQNALIVWVRGWVVHPYGVDVPDVAN